MKINNAAPVINNLNKNNQSLSFGSKGENTIISKGKNYIDDLFSLPANGSMGRKLFLLTAVVFLLGGRLARSRDKKEIKSQNDQSPTIMDYIRNKNEIRETLVRDVPTIFAAVLAVPFIGKKVSEFIQKQSGFVILKNSGESADYSTIDNLYKYDENLQSGLTGFSKRLANLGGNLKKIYSNLNENIKNKLANFSDNNEKFIQELTSNKELEKEIVGTLKSGKNNALRKASFLATVPTLIGFGTTFGLIGMLIPKFNIHLTRLLHKDDNKK